jgi:uncharacterized coiled-coil protein SlyX
MGQFRLQSDGNGGVNVGKALLAILLALAAGIGFTTGDVGDFFDGPQKVREIERIRVELDNLTTEFWRHVESNIDAQRDAENQVDARLDELTARMEAQTQRLDAIYEILVQRGGN